MDFGDILSRWEKKKESPPFRFDPGEVYDKDAERQEDSAETPAERRRRLRLAKSDDVIDIHGLTREEAAAALEAFFDGARRKGHEKLLVIHGKGNHSQKEAVLKYVTRDFIERCPFAGESGYADAAGGGSGATWVLLKARRPR
jgi:DNA-nicking Smr family endonuclease